MISVDVHFAVTQFCLTIITLFAVVILVNDESSKDEYWIKCFNVLAFATDIK